MGSFGGHALPGTFFVLFGLWWMVNMFNRYYSAQRRNARYTSTAIFNCPCLCGRLKELPLEAFVKIFFVVIGFSLEIYTGFDKGRFVNIGNGQHATMFFYFGFTGVVDILMHYKAPLPPDMDYISMLMAITCEGLLFKFHLHGRKDLDVLLHTLLLYVIGASIVSIIVEMKYRHNILASLSRAYILLLQGTWFWQVGFILYPPSETAQRWDQEDHEQMMIATMIFSWHAAVCLLVMLTIGGIVACFHRRFGPYFEDENIGMTRLMHAGKNGQTALTINDESESDIEFQKPV